MTTIRVAAGDYDNVKYIEVEAEVHESGLLAIHLTPLTGGTTRSHDWTITHVPTGMRIARRSGVVAESIMRSAMNSLSVLDWNASSRAAAQKLRGEVERILSEYEMSIA